MCYDWGQSNFKEPLNTISMSNSSDLHDDRNFVSSDLGPNCLQINEHYLAKSPNFHQLNFFWKMDLFSKNQRR